MKNSHHVLQALALSFIICHLSFSGAAAQTVPAFPGAEGHGRYVTGGRGGRIVHVTNLNDSGTGSFRAAVSGSDKKIVVFDVGGVIALTKDMTIGANTTVLGQTAPSPGITLRYYTVQPSSNCIIRFIRCRRGQEKDIDDGADAIWTRSQTGIMIDHCSFSWSIDEVASFYDNNNFTMQWCTIGESLVHSGHTKGAHGYGGIWGGKLASFHHNLICHVANRSPRFNGARYNWDANNDGSIANTKKNNGGGGFQANMLYSQYKWANAVQAENVDLRNCVIYNCGNGCYGGPGGGQVNIVNNYYKTGPAATTNRVTQVTLGASGNASGYAIFWDMTSRYFIEGNTMYNNSTVTSNNWSNIYYDSGTPSSGGVYYTKDPNHYYGADSYTQIDGVDCLPIKLTEPAPTGDITTHTAAKAFDKVLNYAGASLNRDDVDTRYASETRAGNCTYKGSATSYNDNGTIKSCTPTWGRIDLVSDVNGYTEETFGTGSREAGFDSDNDGMADAWETANGLNPNDASDALVTTLDTKGWYTNLEVYANSLVQDIMLTGNGDAQSAVSEYYPAYTKTDGTKVEAINVGEGTSPTPTVSEKILYWESGLTEANRITLSDNYSIQITGNSEKKLINGNTITVDNLSYASIKLSNGAETTVTMPDGQQAVSVTFYSYVNKKAAEASDRDNYWSMVNGISYDAESSGGLMSAFTDVSGYQQNPDVSTTFLLGSVSSFTFKNAGYQPCTVMKVVTTSGTTAIRDVKPAKRIDTAAYNLSGQKVGTDYKGLVIRNGRKLIRR